MLGLQLFFVLPGERLGLMYDQTDLDATTVQRTTLIENLSAALLSSTCLVIIFKNLSESGG